MGCVKNSLPHVKCDSGRHAKLTNGRWEIEMIRAKRTKAEHFGVLMFAFNMHQTKDGWEKRFKRQMCLIKKQKKNTKETQALLNKWGRVLPWAVANAFKSVCLCTSTCSPQKLCVTCRVGGFTAHGKTPASASSLYQPISWDIKKLQNLNNFFSSICIFFICLSLIQPAALSLPPRLSSASVMSHLQDNWINPIQSRSLQIPRQWGTIESLQKWDISANVQDENENLKPLVWGENLKAIFYCLINPAEQDA